MSLYGAFDKTKHFKELSEPLSTAEGMKTPTQRRDKAVQNLTGVTGNSVAKLNQTMRLLPTGAPASIATAGNATYTAAQLLSGIIVRDPAGAGRTDTLDTAANIVAALSGAAVGDIITVHIVNGADAAETITLAAGTGGAFDTNQTAASRVIPQNASKDIRIRLTNVTGGAEAYVVYA